VVTNSLSLAAFELDGPALRLIMIELPMILWPAFWVRHIAWEVWPFALAIGAQRRLGCAAQAQWPHRGSRLTTAPSGKRGFVVHGPSRRGQVANIPAMLAGRGGCSSIRGSGDRFVLPRRSADGLLASPVDFSASFFANQRPAARSWREFSLGFYRAACCMGCSPSR
jgi:hypothetical protein